MITSLSNTALADFVSRQVNTFIPDGRDMDLRQHQSSVDQAVERLAYCFRQVKLGRYCRDGTPRYDHLMADQHCQFLWFLSNQLWKDTADATLADKLFCLNRSLNSFSCMYDLEMPAIFLTLHATGTVLGKGTYGEYFVSHHNCTVGAHRYIFPVIQKGVVMASNSAVIGDCTIGNGASIGTDTTVFAHDIPDLHLARRDESGAFLVQPASRCYAQNFFHVDLSTLQS